MCQKINTTDLCVICRVTLRRATDFKVYCEASKVGACKTTSIRTSTTTSKTPGKKGACVNTSISANMSTSKSCDKCQDMFKQAAIADKAKVAQNKIKVAQETEMVLKAKNELEAEKILKAIRAREL